MLTGEEMARFAINKLGTPYFFGAKFTDGVLSEAKMSLMHRMYASTVTESYMQKARDQGQVGKVNTDCSGLVAGYRGVRIGSSQLYQTAKKRLPIAQIASFSKGVVLWKTGHCGVYLGMENGIPMAVEAKGIRYGTVKRKVADTKWTYGLTFDDLSYDYAESVPGSAKGGNPYEEPSTNLRYDSKKITQVREAVYWLQWELIEAGYFIELDGMFGPKTKAALGAFQKSCKISMDYIMGPITRSYLKANE
ncbi:MAG: peptidoglycan-binding protein [Clostridium sp.]|jgi:hypothetical protein|nr:peptidoglycan-binding protein [Clostridium sp.]